MAVTIGYPKIKCPLDQCLEFVSEVADSGGKDAGEMDKIGNVPGFWFADLDYEDEGAFYYYAPDVILACATATTGDYTQGAKVYYDSSTDKLTTEASGTDFVGFVLEAASVGDTEVEVMFDGRLALV